MTVNLGPIAGSVDAALKIPRNPRADGYGYNPRCLRRDVNNYFTSQYLRPQDIANHITSSKDIEAFEKTLQGDTAKAFSLHTGGHYSIWGDPGGDFYVCDPLRTRLQLGLTLRCASQGDCDWD